MRHLLLILAVGFAFSVRAQTVAGPRVQGDVIEAGEGQPIPFASLLVLGTGQGTVADEAGRFSLALENLPRTSDRGSAERSRSAPILLRVSAIGYLPDTITVALPAAPLTVSLRPDRELPTVTVRGSKRRALTELKPDKYLPLYLAEWGDKVVTCYRRSGRKTYQLRILEPEGAETVHTLDFGPVRGVSSRCSERLYVLTDDYAISMELHGKELTPIERIPRNDYEWLFADCQDRRGDAYLYEKKQYSGMRKLYLLLQDQQAGRLVREYRDTSLLDEYFHGVPIMDFDWVETRRPPMWWSANGKGRRAQALRHFDREIKFKNHTDNPFLFAGNTIRLFNFDQEQVETFTTDGEPVGVTPFPCVVDRRTTLKQRIIRDELTGRLFALARDNQGHRMYYVDPDTGETRYVLHFAVGEVRELVVRGGRFWLLGRRSPTGMYAGWKILRGEV